MERYLMKSQITDRMLDMVNKDFDLNPSEVVEVVVNMMMRTADWLEFEGSEGLSPVQKAAHFFNDAAKKEAS